MTVPASSFAKRPTVMPLMRTGASRVDTAIATIGARPAVRLRKTLPSGGVFSVLNGRSDVAYCRKFPFALMIEISMYSSPLWSVGL